MTLLQRITNIQAELSRKNVNMTFHRSNCPTIWHPQSKIWRMLKTLRRN